MTVPAGTEIGVDDTIPFFEFLAQRISLDLAAEFVDSADHLMPEYLGQPFLERRGASVPEVDIRSTDIALRHLDNDGIRRWRGNFILSKLKFTAILQDDGNATSF